MKTEQEFLDFVDGLEGLDKATEPVQTGLSAVVKGPVPGDMIADKPPLPGKESMPAKEPAPSAAWRCDSASRSKVSLKDVTFFKIISMARF